MGATSVTGVSGPGMSNGKFKPANNNGCGCGGKPKQSPVTTPSKNVCKVRYKTGGVGGYKSNSGGIATNTCS